MGTILSDFTHISGSDKTVPQAGEQEVALSEDFNTGGIRGERSAVLMFSVRPVADPPRPAQADVYINDTKVGEILVTTPGPMYTVQTIAIPVASRVPFKATDGQDNLFAIKNVPRAFAIKDIVCFFHQES
jgi:hypothetical protein